MERLGLSYEELTDQSKTGETSISNFGQTGPYRDFKMSDTIAFAMGGAMSRQAFPSGSPWPPPGNLKLHECSYMAAPQRCWPGMAPARTESGSTSMSPSWRPPEE